MTQMNLCMKEKQAHRQREQTCGCRGVRGVGRGQIGSFQLADANSYI